MKYDVVISHSYKDGEFALRLAELLKQNGISVFTETEIALGDSWKDSIDGAISHCLCVLPIISDNASDSRYFQMEVHLAYMQDKRILPVYTARAVVIGEELEYLRRIDGYVITAPSSPSKEVKRLIRDINGIKEALEPKPLKESRSIFDLFNSPRTSSFTTVAREEIPPAREAVNYKRMKAQILASGSIGELFDNQKPPLPTLGDEQNFVFISYSHKDYKSVYCDLIDLYKNGVRYWYDRGLTPGKGWSAEARAQISKPNCGGVIFYLSDNFVLSTSVLKEVGFALGKGTDGGAGKNYFTVSLSDELPEDLISTTLGSRKRSELDALEIYNKRDHEDILLEAFPNEKTNIIKTDAASDDHIHKVIDAVKNNFNVIADGKNLEELFFARYDQLAKLAERLYPDSERGMELFAGSLFGKDSFALVYIISKRNFLCAGADGVIRVETSDIDFLESFCEEAERRLGI